MNFTETHEQTKARLDQEDAIWGKVRAFGLSTRNTNVLANLNLTTKNEVEMAIKSGLLKPGLGGVGRNYGVKSQVEIFKWLGLELPTKRSVKICPHCGKLL